MPRIAVIVHLSDHVMKASVESVDVKVKVTRVLGSVLLIQMV